MSKTMEQFVRQLAGRATCAEAGVVIDSVNARYVYGVLDQIVEDAREVVAAQEAQEHTYRDMLEQGIINKEENEQHG